MMFTENRVGQLANTPQVIQERFQLLSGQNSAYPRQIEANYPASSVLDIGRPLREVIFLTDELDAAAASGSSQWIYHQDQKLWERFRKSSKITVQSVGVTITAYAGNGTFEFQFRGRYLNAAPTTFDFPLGFLQVDSSSENFEHIVVNDDPITIQERIKAYDVGNEVDEWWLSSLNFIFTRVAGSGTISVYPVMVLELEF